MSTPAALLAAAGIALLVVTLAGLIARRRWSAWYAFTLYIAVVAGFSFAFVAWPDVFWQPHVWLVQTSVVNALRFAVAIELAARTFHAFPGARSTLRPVLLALLGVTLVLVLAIPVTDADYRTVLGEVQPRLLNGTVWLFTAIAALILWYRLPVAPLHKSVLLGYVPYLLFELVYLRVFVELGWRKEAFGYIYPAAYLLLVGHWAWVAWRAEVHSDLEPPGAPNTHTLSQLSAS